MDHEIIKNISVSDEDSPTVDLEVESNNRDSLEVLSSRGDMMREPESAGEVITKVELELACFSEKLLNLEILVMHVASRESDFEAFVSEEDNAFGDSADSAQNALEFDFLSGILESELNVLDNFVSALQVEIDNARGTIFSQKHMSEAFEDMQEKLLDCEKSLKQSMEQVLEIKAQSDNFQGILCRVKHGKDMGIVQNGYSSDLSSKIKMQTAEQQRHILRMLEKSLATELDLEKKLTDLRQNEEILKLRLQQEVFCMEDEVEVVSEKLFEAENFSEVLLRTSRGLLSQIQILKFNLNGFAQREGEMRTRCEELSEKLSMNDLALQNSERKNAELEARCCSHEKETKESEVHLQNLKDSAEKNKESCAKINELEGLISNLKEQVSEAEKRAESTEAENKFLKNTNVELNKDLGLVKSNYFSTSEKVNLLERRLRESDIKLQHAVATAEASEEKQTMLYSTIEDMEDVIKDLKSRVLKAESMTDSVEEKCIILSETNADLNEELNFVRSKMESLEASLHEAEETKRATAKDIGIRTKLIRDLIVQLATERERLHKQIGLLTVEKKILSKRVQKTGKDNSLTTSKEISDSIKGSMLSEDDFASVNSSKATKSEATEISVDKSDKEVHLANAEGERAESTSQLDTVRNIDARQLNFKYVIGALFVVFISGLVAALLQHRSYQF